MQVFRDTLDRLAQYAALTDDGQTTRQVYCLDTATDIQNPPRLHTFAVTVSISPTAPTGVSVSLGPCGLVNQAPSGLEELVCEVGILKEDIGLVANQSMTVTDPVEVAIAVFEQANDLKRMMSGLTTVAIHSVGLLDHPVYHHFAQLDVGLYGRIVGFETAVANAWKGLSLPELKGSADEKNVFAGTYVQLPSDIEAVVYEAFGAAGKSISKPDLGPVERLSVVMYDLVQFLDKFVTKTAGLIVASFEIPRMSDGAQRAAMWESIKNGDRPHALDGPGKRKVRSSRSFSDRKRFRLR